MAPSSKTSQRKDAHLDLCAHEEVEPAGQTTLLECVDLVHCALPEASADEVDVSCHFMGKRLSAPFMMTGMTGGSERARTVNLQLAAVAERAQVAFGVGSQRAMLEAPALATSFAVRTVAPTTLLLGNIGLWQAREAGVDATCRLVEALKADGLAVHLNAAQELTQPEGDRDFRGGYETLEALASALGDRLLVKETGCGLSPKVARRLVSCGVRNLDVSGRGGTSWIRVEELRAARASKAFARWGIPTAAAVASVRAALGPGVFVLASGGIRDGVEAACALALGADAVGMALPLFRAQQEGGEAAVEKRLKEVLWQARQALLLTGSRNVQELRQVPRVIRGALKDWLAALASDSQKA